MPRVPRGSRVAASAAASGGWHRLRVSAEELRVGDTLLNGQCFGWRALSSDEVGSTDDTISKGAGPELVGVLGDNIVGLRDLPDDVEFRWRGGSGASDPATLRTTLSEYFQLGMSLTALRAKWSRGDVRMAQIAKSIPGMRVVRQDPTECLFSFLCSSNNHIGRITMMLSRLRERYGTKLGDVGGVEVYSFPSVDALASASEEALRELGFGYRAPFVVQSALRVKANGGEAWLESLRAVSLEDARSKLVTLHGVGRKVADCIAVFSLDKTACVPCDTHVWRIACRDMDPTLAECKSLTPAVHERVNDLFVSRFGEHAGWAHSLLFAAELPQFVARLPHALQIEMKLFREDNKRANAERKRVAASDKEAAGDGGARVKTATHSPSDLPVEVVKRTDEVKKPSKRKAQADAQPKQRKRRVVSSSTTSQ